MQSVVVDATDALWVLDPAAPLLASICPAGPKLVKIDLATNKVTRVISFGPDVAKKSSYLNDVRFDNRRNVAYTTDSGVGTFTPGADGAMFITASHISEEPTNNHGKSIRKLPFTVFKFQP